MSSGDPKCVYFFLLYNLWKKIKVKKKNDSIWLHNASNLFGASESADQWSLSTNTDVQYYVRMDFSLCLHLEVEQNRCEAKHNTGAAK